jgi:hypothetical protein
MVAEAERREDDRRRTLGELVHAYAWADVQGDFERMYPGDPGWTVQHARVFSKLRALRPRLSQMEIVIDDAQNEGGEAWIDVSGRKGDELVAIEFVDWAEWLGMVVDHETSHRYTPTEILAHCVWEMSFFGFDEDTIRKKWGEIEDLASREGTSRRNRRG